MKLSAQDVSEVVRFLAALLKMCFNIFFKLRFRDKNVSHKNTKV